MVSPISSFSTPPQSRTDLSLLNSKTPQEIRTEAKRSGVKHRAVMKSLKVRQKVSNALMKEWRPTSRQIEPIGNTDQRREISKKVKKYFKDQIKIFKESSAGGKGPVKGSEDMEKIIRETNQHKNLLLTYYRDAILDEMIDHEVNIKEAESMEELDLLDRTTHVLIPEDDDDDNGARGSQEGSGLLFRKKKRKSIGERMFNMMSPQMLKEDSTRSLMLALQ